jgi:hypothetical protein
MPTVNTYRYVKQGNPEAYRLDPTGANPVQEGDMVMYDTLNLFVLPLTAGNATAFTGVAEGVGPTPVSNIDNKPNLVDSVKVRRHGIFTFNKTAGDSLKHEDPLKIGADAQTVALATLPGDLAEVIGFVHNPLGSAPITGAGTVDVEIRTNAPTVGAFGV